MTGPFSTRRRAEEFNAAISRPLTEQDAKEFAALLAVVRDLRAVPQPAPRSDFVSDLRERLMAEADTALLPQAARPLTPTEQRLVLPVRSYRRDRRLATALGAAAIVGATSSMVVAAQTALPGESLYPVKRAIEQAETGIAGDDTARGQALLANASGRLDEIRALTERNTPVSSRAVDDTLTTFIDQADAAADALLAAYAETGDKALVAELRTFTSSSMERLSALEPVVPESAHASMVEAGEHLAAIDRRASLACPTCGGSATSIPPNLLNAGHPTTSVTMVILAASQNPSLLERPKPVAPDPVSGQETGGVEVPDLQVPPPTPTASATPTPKTPEVDLKKPLNDATKLLTGDLSTALGGLPVTDQLLTDVGTTLDGTVDGVQDSIDGTTDPLVP